MNPYHIYITNPTPDVPELPPHPSALPDLGYDNCTAHVEQEVQSLFHHYGRVLYGARYGAPCCVYRSERILQNDERLPRFANRVHIFQEQKPPTEATRALLENYGRYLGYISLRPATARTPGKKAPSEFSVAVQEGNVTEYHHVVVANIAPPEHMQRPRYHVITELAGPPDFVLPFRSSHFCVPDPLSDSRAGCLYAAVHQAVLLKAHAYGLTPIGGHDMMALLWSLDPDHAPPHKFSDQGASLEHALGVLRDKNVNGGGIVETFAAKDFPNASEQEQKRLATREALRCITDYLANGIPIVLEQRRLGEYDHAVLVLGMHLLADPEDCRGSRLGAGGAGVQTQELPGRLILHDSYSGPYTEESTATILHRAWYPDENDTECSGISFLAVAPRGTRLGVRDVRLLAQAVLQSEPADFLPGYRAYLSGLGCRVPEDFVPELSDLRYVTRLLKTWQIERRYLTADPGEKQPLQARQALRDTITKAEDAGPQGAYWWCVEVRFPITEPSQQYTDRMNDDLTDGFRVPQAVVYMYHVGDSTDCQPRAILRYKGKSSVVLTVEKGEGSQRFEFQPSLA